MKRLSVVLVVLLVLVGAGVLAGRARGSDDGGDSLRSIELRRRDGSSASFADYEGRPVLVNVFASWCRPCIEEMPALERAQKRFAGEVRVLGVSIDPNPADGWQVVDRTGVTYDVAHTEDRSLLRRLGGVGMPTTALLAADGALLDVRSGAATEEEFVEWVREVLGGDS